MQVNDIVCISLGITEKPPSDFQGKTTQGYFALDYVVVNENSSRRQYIDDMNLKNAAMRYCGAWGAMFKINGEISPKGILTINSITAAEEKRKD